MRLLAAVLALTILSPIGGRTARADVLEIDDHGAVHVRTGVAAVAWHDPGAEADDSSDGFAEAFALPDAAVTTLASPARAPAAWQAPLMAVASRYKVSPDLLAALVWQESRWHPAAVSPKGAVGLTQLMPATARGLAVDARDPVANLDGGAHYLRQLLDQFDGDIERALAAYNAGPRRVQGAGGVPRIAETRAYVANIIGRLTPDLPLGPTQ